MPHPQDDGEIVDALEWFIDQIFGRRRHRHHARRIHFRFFGVGKYNFKGDRMTFTMPPLNPAGQPSTVPVIGVPIDATGALSPAQLSNGVYQSSDPAVFTVTNDPNAPGGAIITAVGNPAPGSSVSATLTESATATEPDGSTTENITGSATIILATAVQPPPPPAPAAAIQFVFGTPQ